MNDRETTLDVSGATCFSATPAKWPEPLKAEMTRDGWRKCAEGQKTTQFCGLLDAAVKAEREACALVCDKQSQAYMSSEYTTDPLGGFREKFAAEQCAAAIRARGEA